MLSNKEYAQIITALIHATNEKKVDIHAVNSMLRLFTTKPGELTLDHENNTVYITQTKADNFFSRLARRVVK